MSNAAPPLRPVFPADGHFSMIAYPNYKFVFPIQALGMFAKRFGNSNLV